MKSIKNILVAIVMLLSSVAGNAQIKNAKTETVKVYGNCGICKKTIEKAGNLKKVVSVDWNKNTKMATVTYNSKKTNQDEILKRIALAGYDSDKFLAPDKVYKDLAECCKYERVGKIPIKSDAVVENHTESTKGEAQNPIKSEQMKPANQIKAVFDNYFAVKDALVKTDGATASTKSAELLKSINVVKMDQLETDVHMLWMEVLADLKEDAARIAETKDASRQRDYFMTLSKNIYSLMKASKYDETVYYQFCPMANDGKGANWLSKDNEIKNPYYGSQMMNCGKTVETIK